MAAKLRAEYPNLPVLPVTGDFAQLIELPELPPHGSVAGFFPGSTIGNFGPPAAAAVLRNMRQTLGAGCKLVLGADLKKDRATLEAAYDDAAGVTAAFNRNLLVRLNRDLGANFDADAYDHESRWNADDGRVEMHLVARAPQTVTVGGTTVEIAAGESLHTENSHKFDRDLLHAPRRRRGVPGRDRLDRRRRPVRRGRAGRGVRRAVPSRPCPPARPPTTTRPTTTRPTPTSPAGGGPRRRRRASA